MQLKGPEPMLRLSDIRLDIEHTENDLKTAILKALGIGGEDLIN